MRIIVWFYKRVDIVYKWYYFVYNLWFIVSERIIKI